MQGLPERVWRHAHEIDLRISESAAAGCQGSQGRHTARRFNHIEFTDVAFHGSWTLLDAAALQERASGSGGVLAGDADRLASWSTKQGHAQPCRALKLTLSPCPCLHISKRPLDGRIGEQGQPQTRWPKYNWLFRGICMRIEVLLRFRGRHARGTS